MATMLEHRVPLQFWNQTRKSRYQVGPNKRRRCPKVHPPGDVASPARARRLERNRLAANKCRLKKKREQLEIQHALNEATSKRNTLLAGVNASKEETCCTGKMWRPPDQPTARKDVTKTNPVEPFPAPIFVSFRYLLSRKADRRGNSNRPVYSITCAFGDE
ncbi:hypothetical protein N7451_012354 [Penicillium sp. IBT 35674x]|nr:hypothetical protein N7451_012354 [Penicillium sp. IBT 35674x]